MLLQADSSFCAVSASCTAHETALHGVMAQLAGLMLVTKHPGLTDAGHDCLLPPHRGPVVLQMQLPVRTTGIEVSV